MLWIKKRQTNKKNEYICMTPVIENSRSAN